MAVKANPLMMEQVLRYIDGHLEESITVHRIAGEFGYSEYHFARMFKLDMAVSVMDYVNKRRMIKASEEILAGEKVIDAAMKYGWQSHSGFTKAFKKEFGFAPSLLKVMMTELEHLGGNAMNHVFLYQEDGHASKESLFGILKGILEENKIDADAAELERVYAAACKAYDGVMRYSGDEYMTHLLNVAIILAQLEADANVIEAGMFCDVTKKTKITLECLEEELPDQVFGLVKAAAEFDVNQEECMDQDAALIKIAERLHNMRTISFMEEEKRESKAKETIRLFMPIARRLGNQKVVDELNDLSMRYIL